MDVTPKNERENRTVVPFFRSGDYFFHRGIIAYRKNHLQRAVRLFERAVKLTDKEPIFHVQLAAVLSELGEYERSIEILNHILKEQKGEEQIECYFFLANNYAYLGLFEKAEKAALQYLEHSPKEGFADDARDLLFLLQDERDEIEGWEEDESESEELIIDHAKARTLLREGKLNEAIPILEAIIADYPTCWAAHNHLAEAYFRLGDEVAFEISEHILAEDAGNLFAICNLALFFTEKGDAKQAKPFIEALKQVYPLDMDHHVKVAQVLCAAGEYEQAIERLRAVEGYVLDNEPELLYCLGIAFLKRNLAKKTMSYWRRAAKLGFEQARVLLRELENQRLDENKVVYRLWK